MKPSDILTERPAPPITISNAKTGFQPMEFANQRAYERWVKAQDAGASTVTPRVAKSLKAVVPRKVEPSAIARGVGVGDGEPEVMGSRTRSRAAVSDKPAAKPSGAGVDLSHDYDTDYPEFNKRADGEDDEDDGDAKGAGSKVSKKVAGWVATGNGGANSVLIDEIGQKTYAVAFFSFPMLHGGGHQFYSKKEPLDVALHSGFKSEINAADYPMDRRGAAKSGPKIVFLDNSTLKDATVASSEIIARVFKGEPLAVHGGRPIFWVNHEDRDRAKSFALSHWVRIAPGTKLEDGDIVDHFIFGYYDTGGIPMEPTEPAKVMPQFNVGYIERITDSYGMGAVALKRISDLKPNRALNLGGEGKDSVQLDGLDEKVNGEIFRNPWQDVKAAIKKAYSRKPKKLAKLLEITDQIIGRSASQPARYPIKIEGISVKDVGFSTNALTVDFMEILHPLVAMKPEGVLNNGIYNAVRTYLGERGESGMTFDLTKMVVGYPNAANAKLFDSELINPVTGGRLLISSKDGEGAMPGAGSLGAVYNLFEKHLKHFEEEDSDPEMGRFITREMSSAPEEYKQMMRFFGALGRGADKARLKDELLPTEPGARRLAVKVLKNETGIAKALNKWDGGNRFSGGGFLKFVTSVLRFSPLVQINTMSTKNGAPEFDRADDVTITGFLATWPNTIFDNIEFHELNGLRFKISAGAGTGEVSIRQKNDSQGNRVHKKVAAFNRWSGRDYRGVMKHTPRYTYTSKINKMKVPGFGKSWDVLTNRLSAEFKDILKQSDGRLTQAAIRAVRNQKFMSLVDLAMDFQVANGFDPGMSGIPDMTMRDLLNTIGQALEG